MYSIHICALTDYGARASHPAGEGSWKCKNPYALLGLHGMRTLWFVKSCETALQCISRTLPRFHRLITYNKILNDIKLIPSERRESVLSYCLIFFPKLHKIDLEITVSKKDVSKTRLSRNNFFATERAQGRVGENSDIISCHVHFESSLAYTDKRHFHTLLSKVTITLIQNNTFLLIPHSFRTN